MMRLYACMQASKRARKYMYTVVLLSGVNLVWNLEVVDPGKKYLDFSRQISKNFDFSHKKFDFPGKFMKNFDFVGNFTKKFDFPGKIGHFRLLLSTLFYFFQ